MRCRLAIEISKAAQDFSIVREPQSFADPAQGDWIHRRFHAPRTALSLDDERQYFLAAVWIAHCLERCLPVYCGRRALASKHSTNLQYPVCRLECPLLTIYRESSFVGLWIAIESSRRIASSA